MDRPLGERIRTLRQNLSMSQRELAMLMGVTPQAASKWEHGYSCPDIMSLYKLSRVLQISLDDLLAPEFSLPMECKS
ncbi:MAG: helix-turn-helix domain-containing protein [Christensenellales bacterium]|jgi:transcriptional regulator with XRE-family HTH domain